MADTRPGEFELIRTYFAPLASDPGSVGLTDDAAVFSPRSGYDLVLTKDVLAAGVHFFAEDPPQAIAAKALRVNLSDIAAKGATPRGYLLGLALPADWTADWLERFCAGLADDQAAYEVRLFGGDTIRSGNGLQVSITAIGEVPSGRAVRRSGAKSGDVLFVSGTIGDAAAGLKARLDDSFCRERSLNEAEEQHVLGRYLLPRPRTCLAELICRRASAAMDISDGLFADSEHMARVSGAGLEIDLAKIPLSDALKRLQTSAGNDYLSFLNGGDDYEILATVPAADAVRFSQEAASAGCPVAEIGRVTKDAGQVTLMDGGQQISFQAGDGFTHF
ncbi:thiamine-phosphate kinase [Roseibium sp. MMSF_3544]|uniref:thiamine-phosphate kinase n=1 Tax=unclassified Roseibium TaxID=2629323 RepID=UPI00273F20D5|nr:thiamine-phosphate kinase [Roseibium sp. MMSF_3544]